MSDERIPILQDALEKELKESGNTEDAKKLARALKVLTQPTLTESAGIGFRQGGERLLAGGQEALTFPAQSLGLLADSEEMVSGARERRAEIAGDMAKSEALFDAKTARMEPLQRGFAFGGEMALPTLVSGGRTPAAAATRGALTGALSFTPDLGTFEGNMLRGLQAGLGAGAGAFGQRVLAPASSRLTGPLFGTGSVGRQAREVGLRASPEETIPTFRGKDAVRNFRAFEREAFKNAKFNQEQITTAALDDAGIGGTRFVDPDRGVSVEDTLDSIKNNASDLFNQVKESSERIIFRSSDLKRLDDIVTAGKADNVGTKAAAKAAQEIRRTRIANKGVIPFKEYMRLRTDLTDKIRTASSGTKRNNLGNVLDLLDDSAARSMPKETLATYQKARHLWKEWIKFSAIADRQGGKGINPETGLIDPNAYNAVVRKLDRNNFFARGSRSRANQMMIVNRQIAGAMDVSADPSRLTPGLRARFQPQGGVGGVVDIALKQPIQRAGLTLNRLPGDLITDLPAGAVPPALNLTPLLGQE